MSVKRLSMLNRRCFLALASSGCLIRADEQVTYPVISEDACPLERITPVAQDGHQGLAFMRKPRGRGPFPLILIIHGGLSTWPEEQLKMYSLTPTPSRFLAAGYAVVETTYRGRDEDPQSKVSLEDCLAAIQYVRRLGFVDSKSIIAFGCSGGGDLALEIAARTEVCAIVAEEPASMLLTGIFNAKLPKKGERYAPGDGAFISENPKRYYTPEHQKFTLAKIKRIRCPILIVQGDQTSVNHFNAEVLIPELRAAGKSVEVMTYPSEPHCFCFYGSGPRTPHPAAALKAYRDIDSFCERYLSTKPRAIEPSLIKLKPLTSG